MKNNLKFINIVFWVYIIQLSEENLFIDYENPQDSNGDNIYEFVVNLSNDNNIIDSLPVNVVVQDREEPTQPNDAVGAFNNWAPVFDSDGKQIVQISSTVNGEGSVSTYNNEGYEIVKLTSTTNGDGYISTSNNEGIEMVQLSSTSKGKGVISTFLIKEKDKKK